MEPQGKYSVCLGIGSMSTPGAGLRNSTRFSVPGNSQQVLAHCPSKCLPGGKEKRQSHVPWSHLKSYAVGFRPGPQSGVGLTSPFFKTAAKVSQDEQVRTMVAEAGTQKPVILEQNLQHPSNRDGRWFDRARGQRRHMKAAWPASSAQLSPGMMARQSSDEESHLKESRLHSALC